MKHALTRVTEECRKNLDNNRFIGTVLMDLVKTFNCISHDLMTGKLAVDGFAKKYAMLHLIIHKKKKTMCQHKQY